MEWLKRPVHPIYGCSTRGWVFTGGKVAGAIEARKNGQEVRPVAKRAKRNGQCTTRKMNVDEY